MPLDTLQRLRAQLPHTRPFLMYGLTEAFRATYLAPEELEAAVRDAGAAPVSLGAQVLRVETAALFAVSATQAVLGARGG